MLHTDNIKIEEIPFIHNYSDSGFMIEREDGKRFSDAKDLAIENHTYIETDEPIPIDSGDDPQPETDIQQKAEAYDYLINGEGESENE